MWRERAAAPALSLGLLLGVSTAWAGGSDVEVRCDALDAEGRAALEARARVDLAARAVDGKVAVGCERGVLEITLSREGRPLLRRTERQPDDPAATIDLALAALDGLLADATPRIAPPRTALVPPPPPTLVSRPPPPPPPAPRATIGLRPGLAFWLAAGADLQLWSGAAKGAAGPYVAARLALGAVTFDLEGGARIGFASPHGFSIRMGEGLAGADVTLPFAPVLSVGGGLGVAYLVAAAPDGITPPTLSAVSLLGRLRARARLDLGAFDVHLGPELAILAPPAVVALRGAEVARAPAASFGIALDVGARLLP